MRPNSALLPAVGLSFVAMVGSSLAQGWSGGGPVFQSDVQQRAQQLETERAERRKNYGPVIYPKFMNGGEQPNIQPVAPEIVHFDRNEEVGSIIVDTQAKKLYYVLANKKAYQYPISVGRDGFTWTGTERISRIAAWPSWTPPATMHKRQPGLPITVTGGLKNPQGARALYLGSTIYRIHGTNNDRTVGRANSSGCFRLRNEHVVHLAGIAKVGTKVKVLQAYKGGVSEQTPLASAASPFASLFGFGGDEKPAAPATAPARKPLPKKQAAKKTAAVVPPPQPAGAVEKKAE